MCESREPKWDELEVDKVPGAWLITWWMPDDSLVLRLKVTHCGSTEPNEFVAEAKVAPTDEFIKVGEFMHAVYAVIHPDQFDQVWKDLPGIWTEEFKALLRVWARLTDVAEFGSTVAERYASEPASSIDHFVEQAE